ncbi:MAG TPA: hypothetical protein VFG30_10280 [Polyangiales bacterium]|nr:hypothetical protein [Polyangiales bacterium]
MRKSIFLGCLYACAVSAALIACGDDGGDAAAAGSGASGSPAGGSGGSGGSGGGGVAMDDPINADCPISQGPFMGPYAMKGKCCYRTSNTSRLGNLTDGKVTLEYRISYFIPNNHPKTISGLLITSTSIDRFDKEEQHLLMRFIVPYADGNFVAGMGTAQIGAGRYNCDGTYSFYNTSAAANTPVWMDPSRWATSPVPITVDPTQTAWEKEFHTVWATNINRKVTNLPYITSMGAKPLEWEAASQGFDIIKMPPAKDSINCIGSRADQDRWQPDGQTVSYQRLDLNNKSAIQVLANISLAQLQAFGSNIAATKDDPKYDPLKAARCKPGDAGCQWLKLPDSLCPVTDEEMSQWGCHVGDAMNEDKIVTKCTADKPTAALDPDKGATMEGQCCDPLATGGALPACNAYRLVSDIVASAVDITDEPSSKVQGSCEGM